MAASPSYGDRPPLQGPRRSFTVPARQLSVHERAALDDADAGAEVFYTHPKARIISFKPAKESIVSTSTEQIPYDTDYPVDTVETLPWRSRPENLLATGQMIFEKVRGSGNFLKCQSVVRPLMRNSQCWCVDNESKFVLRTRAFEYYRIEVPYESDSDKEKVEEMKRVWPKLVRYEKTPCPFVRAFSVDLPGDAITPRRKGAWTRRESSLSRMSDLDSPTERFHNNDREAVRRAPPSSYPRNAPVFGSPLSGGRPGSSGSPWSPSTSRPTAADQSDEESEHGNDVRHGGGEEEEEEKEEGDEARGRTVAPRQLSTPVPVSIRIASIERSRDPPMQRPSSSRRRLTVDTRIQIPPAVELLFKENLGRSKEDDSQSSKEQKKVAREQQTQPAQATTHQESIGQEPFDESQATQPPPDVPATSLEPTPTISDEPLEPQNAPNVNDEAQIIVEDFHPESQDEKDLPKDTVELEQPKDKCDEWPMEEDEINSQEPVENLGVLKSDAVVDAVDADSHEEPIPKEIEPNSANQIDDQLKEIEPSATQGSEDITPANQTACNSDVLGSIEEDLPSESGDAAVMAADDNLTSPDQAIMSAEGDRKTEDMSTADLDEYKNVAQDDDDDHASIISSTDSFHTIISNEQGPDFDKTPSAESPEPFLRPKSLHNRGISELTVTGNAAGDAASEATASGTSTPTNEAIQTGLRQRLRARRSFSPMPPASTIITNPQARQEQYYREWARTILHIAVVTPLEATLLIMHVVRRIAAGATPSELLSGELFRRPQPHQQRVAGRVDGSDRVPVDGADGRGDDDTQEDDFGVPLRGRHAT